MSQTLFQSACSALWGPRYRSDAARALGLGMRTVMRYAANERDVPIKVLAGLDDLLRLRHHAITGIRADLRAEVKRRREEAAP